MVVVFLILGVVLVVVVAGVFFISGRRSTAEKTAAHVAAGRGERQGEVHKVRAEGRGDL